MLGYLVDGDIQDLEGNTRFASESEADTHRRGFRRSLERQLELLGLQQACQIHAPYARSFYRTAVCVMPGHTPAHARQVRLGFPRRFDKVWSRQVLQREIGELWNPVYDSHRQLLAARHRERGRDDPGAGRECETLVMNAQAGSLRRQHGRQAATCIRAGWRCFPTHQRVRTHLLQARAAYARERGAAPYPFVAVLFRSDGDHVVQ